MVVDRVEWGSATFWSGASLSFLRKNVFAFVVRTCRTLHGVFPSDLSVESRQKRFGTRM